MQLFLRQLAIKYPPNRILKYVKIKILAIVFLQEKGRVRTSLPHSVGGRNNDPFSFMTENYVKQGFVLARNIPYESPILGMEDNT